MMKKENPRSRLRCALCQMFTDKDVSIHTQAEMTECMADKADEEKERLLYKKLDSINEKGGSFLLSNVI